MCIFNSASIHIFLIAQRQLSRVFQRLPKGLGDKISARNAGDAGLIPGCRRSLGEGNDNPIQFYCWGNSMDGGAWQAAVQVHGLSKESDVT